MRISFITALSLFFISCSDNYKNEIRAERLDQRVNRLEQQVNALTDGRSGTSAKARNGKSAYGSDMPGKGSTCQAITQKGIPCKRKAKSNHFCWQHGG